MSAKAFPGWASFVKEWVGLISAAAEIQVTAGT